MTIIKKKKKTSLALLIKRWGHDMTLKQRIKEIKVHSLSTTHAKILPTFVFIY